MRHPNEDPALTSARHEAIVVGIACACAMLYTVGYCAVNGYGRKIEDLTYVLGFPDWIFWGIVVPWGVSILFSIYFGAFYMQDADLGVDLEGSEDEDFFAKESSHEG